MSEELITQLEAEIVKRDARIAELEAPMLAWSELDYTKHTRRSLMCYIGQQNFRIALLEKQTEKLGAARTRWERLAQTAWDKADVEFAADIATVIDAVEGKVQQPSGAVLPERKAVTQSWNSHADAEAIAHNPCRAQAVPDGYVLVPVDPTPEMLDRYPFNVSAVTSEPMDKEDLRVVYQAMLAAAPSAQQKESDDE